jgi:hypothetical protein
MDPSLQPLADTFTKLVIFAIILSVISFYLKRKLAVWRGYKGEQKVLRFLATLDPEYYIIAYDIMLPSNGNSQYTQIDHIVISNYGIFCIETKAYKGWIFGSANRKFWTQTIYKHKERFYNPLYQNYAHIKAIETLCKNYLKTPIISLVVFPYADKLKISGTENVVNMRGLRVKIAYQMDLVYSNEERDRIYHLLMNNNIADKDLRKEHIQEIKSFTHNK